MKISITKESLENMLGFEINDFKIEHTQMGLDIYIQPKIKIEHINITTTIVPTETKFEE